jgi:hypothetical protein
MPGTPFRNSVWSVRRSRARSPAPCGFDRWHGGSRGSARVPPSSPAWRRSAAPTRRCRRAPRWCSRAGRVLARIRRGPISYRRCRAPRARPPCCFKQHGGPMRRFNPTRIPLRTSRSHHNRGQRRHQADHQRQQDCYLSDESAAIGRSDERRGLRSQGLPSLADQALGGTAKLYQTRNNPTSPGLPPE